VNRKRKLSAQTHLMMILTRVDQAGADNHPTCQDSRMRFAESEHPSEPAVPNQVEAGSPRRIREVLRTIGRLLLGAALVFAGVGHLTTQRLEFQAQVPPWLPLDADFVVIASGVVEIVLGVALLIAPRVVRPLVGAVVAGFFVAIFPGNIAQWIEARDAFGLDTDQARFVRLFFQPVLVIWALWSSGAWRWWRERVRARR
jgi:uncharacterized membrane protein